VTESRPRSRPPPAKGLSGRRRPAPAVADGPEVSRPRLDIRRQARRQPLADQGTGRERPAGWKRDPTGRHFGRYWDGQQWTAYVVSPEKVQSLDPLPPPPEPSLFRDGPPPPEPTATRGVSARTTAMPQAEAPTTVMRSAGGVLNAREPEERRTGALASVQAWPRWARWTVGVVAILVLVGVIGSATEDGDQPISVVGDTQTTLTLPVATTVAPPVTAPATTLPPTTQAPTTVTTPATTRPPATTAATAATAPATTAATTPATQPSNVYYANCAAVRAAGAAPIRRGEPGYAAHLDRDNDGVGCE
jgi:hypothetical protein